MSLYIGLMSGTSMDGIDAALINTDNHQFIHGITRPYSEHAQHFLDQALVQTKQEIGYFNQLNTILGCEFALAAMQVLAESNYQASDITAIGSHGQTIAHDAMAKIPYTVQLGCAHTIAEMTGITVVADFRTRDLATGGQGAPFAPVYHQALFKKNYYPLAVVNVGGIANITWLGDSGSVKGYDTGPGNCLMDAWTDMHLQMPYDDNGNWAATGKIINSLLDKMLADSYFSRSAPKSIGKEYFSLEWLNQRLNYLKKYNPEDIQATLLRLTAHTIANAVRAEAAMPGQLIICGGGAHNRALLAALSELLSGVEVISSQALGISPDYIEAMMFAWLAEKTITRTPVNLSTITGARHAAILGAIYPAGILP
ncbi:anhydro-N-acetylmuramic acid kinase [Legionella dresdenensis]|uniref:Anhydro-N-acetylmuramic acid kinase n=1 Tax=Legionella dresdenensis TaxID=450200 RepID=A0ABV8CC07_9GAMM